MTKEPKEHLTLKELMQIRESLDCYSPDLEQKGKLSKSTEKLEKLALHLPEWFLFTGFIAGFALNAFHNSYLKLIGYMLIIFFVILISYRQGFERGCVQGFKDALTSVQTAIDQEDFLEEG
ncbi:MAG: hypothetical protein ACHQX0_02575 [Desulfobaccales bacterium]